MRAALVRRLDSCPAHRLVRGRPDLMLVVYATATFVAVRQEFQEQLDDQLHDDFESAEGLPDPTPDGRVAWAGDRHHDPDNDEDRAATCGRRAASRFGRSGASAAAAGRARATAARSRTYEIDRRDGRRWRTLTGTTLVGGRVRRSAGGAIRGAPARAAVGDAGRPRVGFAARGRSRRRWWVRPRAASAGADRSSGSRRRGGSPPSACTSV